jgi:acetate kinase
LKKTRDVIENHCGLAGLTGTSGSMLSILHLADEKVEDNDYVPGLDKSEKNCSKEDAKLAIEVFCYRIKKYIGAYAASLGGVDVVAFTGQIGSGSSVIRKKILENLDYLNFETEVIEADEELAIAQKLSAGL